ncbi:extracellular superoxide dismutase [Cu-Zn]-like [Gouania willdenowi]|uniref:Superoxide dismutase [Cu-Zn] n=1 Tax=Gouania willdenowi TaxID=441366 RepID=A0A8C5EPM1_GOUWI|nr:extracellular superoxide dismutase [Cu-Zn] [Gouania willdenowi]
MLSHLHRPMDFIWSVSTLGAVLVLLAGSQQWVSAHSDSVAPPEVSQYNGTLYATCRMKPSTTLPDDLPKVYGRVVFMQEYPQGKLRISLSLNGFPSGDGPQARAVHIHQYGDLSHGCDATGGHYNPHGADHPNHPGDFGNFEPRQGRITTQMESEATLFGNVSVIGRAVVIHEKMDDLGQGGDSGSLLHGNAGRRLGCCVIGISSADQWNRNQKLLARRLRI